MPHAWYSWLMGCYIIFFMLSFQASKQRVIDQIEDGIKRIPPLNQLTSDQSFVLIIDGKSLTYALEDDVKLKLSSLATKCASVICCRSTSMQKVLVSFVFHFAKLLYLPFVFSVFSF
jgi:magnesium-transporting ATPase (P-type)